MNTQAPLVRVAFALALGGAATALAADLPVVEGSPAVATVNGDPIWLKDIEREITMLHAMQEGGDRKAARQNPTKILDRMITAKLLSQEARNIGLDETPEGKQELERVRAETVRDLYNREILKDVKADPAMVQQILRNDVAEYRVRSVLFAKEGDMKEFEAKRKAGTDFDTAVPPFVKAGKAKEGNVQEWLKGAQMHPSVLEAVRKLKIRGLSPAVRIDAGWAYVRLLEVRYPANPEAKERAEVTALAEARDRKLAAHVDALRKRLVTFDEKAIAALDFDKGENYEAAKKDTRTIVRIAGGAPITVADLAEALNKRFFHGIDKALQAKRLSAEKRAVLEDLVSRRLVLQDARRMGIDKSQEFGVVVDRKMAAYLFGTMVQRVILPEVKLQRSDLEAYLKEHQSEYTTPPMIALEAVAFDDRKAADDALGRLQRGADFAWLKANTPGQTPATDKRLMQFAPGLMVESVIPGALLKSLSGAGPGDFRFHGEGSGPWYVVHVVRREAAKPASLDAVQEQVGKLAFQEKLNRQIDDWGTKLRNASEVKIFATGDELLGIVMRDMAAGS